MAVDGLFQEVFSLYLNSIEFNNISPEPIYSAFIKVKASFLNNGIGLKQAGKKVKTASRSKRDEAGGRTK